MRMMGVSTGLQTHYGHTQLVPAGLNQGKGTASITIRAVIKSLVECCFTFTETVGLLGTGAQDGHLDSSHSS